MKHTISVFVKNESGILSRISNLFSSRGYAVESITMASCVDDDYARATIVVDVDDDILVQINKQLNKLIPVINVMDANKNDHIYELVFMKIFTENSAKLLEILKHFEFKILDLNKNIYTVRIVCESSQIGRLKFLLSDFEVKDIVRSGSVAI